MTKKTENLNPVQLPKVENVDAATSAGAAAKKPFVEPEVSLPLDVLEATTFFQTGDSGQSG